MDEGRVDDNYSVEHQAKSTYEAIQRLYEDAINGLISQPPNHLPTKTKYQLLQEDVEKLEKELDEAKTAHSASCENVDKLREEYEKLKKEAEEKKNQEEIMSRKKSDLEKEYALLVNSKLSSHDEQMLQKAMLEYKAVRNMTQVRFSFENPHSDILEGFVFNHNKNNVSNFSLNTSEMSKEQIQEHIMGLMENVSGVKSGDILKEDQ